MGEQLANDCGSPAWFRRADVADAEDVHALVQAAVDRIGRLDVMVNNAGISSKMVKSFLDDDLADFSKVMSVNLLGVMLGTREAARYMAANDGGSIINVASIGGLQARWRCHDLPRLQGRCHTLQQKRGHRACAAWRQRELSCSWRNSHTDTRVLSARARRRIHGEICGEDAHQRCATTGLFSGKEPLRTLLRPRFTTRRARVRPVPSSPWTAGLRSTA